MCCFFLTLLFLGPRAGFLLYWLFPLGRAQINLAFDSWIVLLLGVIFIPWTTLMWAFVHGANGVVGFDWVWIGLAIVFDIATYTGGAYKRRSVPYYPANAP